MTQPLTFETPASTANLGPGYGVLGLALDLRLTTTVERTTDAKVVVERHDDPEANALDPRHDTVLRGLRAAAKALNVDLSGGLRLVVKGDVPRGAGLGTNSAGFAAGIGAAVRLAKTTLPSETLLPQSLDPAWRFVLVLPDLQIGTADIKRVLPATLPHAVITRNTSRLIGLLHALAKGDEDLLGPCLFDEAHVPFRQQLVRGTEKALAAGRDSGAAGVTISGHGPSLLALTTDESKAEKIGRAMAEVFRDNSVPARSMVLRASLTGTLPDAG